MTLISQIMQYAISGITSGSIYAIVGICWSTVYLISGVLNFATGEFVMVGGMLTWAFFDAGLSLVSSALLAIFCTTLMAMMLERLVIRPVRYPTEMTYMLITIAAASVIKGLILLGFGTETRTLSPFLRMAPISISGAVIIPQALVVLGTLILITLGLFLLLNYTLFGKALRASSLNQIGAALIGIRVTRFRLFCFGLAGALGAAAGIVITPIAFTGYNVGLMTALKGLVVGIVGGWTIGGTVLAGLLLGLVEGFVAGFISSGWRDALALMAMIAFLILQTMEFSRQRRKRLSE